MEVEVSYDHAFSTSHDVGMHPISGSDFNGADWIWEGIETNSGGIVLGYALTWVVSVSPSAQSGVGRLHAGQ